MSSFIKLGSGRESIATFALRRQNRESLISLLASRGPMTRGQLAQEAGLTGAAVSRITREMIDAGVVLEGNPIANKSRAGRRESLLSINPAGAFVLAISLTANRRNITIANALGEAMRTVSCEDIDLGDPESCLREMASRAKSLVYDADFNRSRLLGAGVSAAISVGRSDGASSGTITLNPLGWRDVPVQSILSKELALPVRIEHRASAILRAELKQNPADSDVYLVNVAVGIGSAARLGNRFLSSRSEGFGSLSHFTDMVDRTPCPCGKRGCMEVTAGGPTILELLNYGDVPIPSQARLLNEAITRANAGDVAHKEAFLHAGRRLALGVGAILSLFNPDSIILSGEVGRQADYILGVKNALKEAGFQGVEDLLSPSAITSVEAAISVALQEYVITGSLDLEQLKTA